MDKNKLNSVLHFIAFLLLLSCKKTSQSPLLIYNNVNLGGSKWVLYQYKDAGTSNPISRNDTLSFINNKEYYWNQSNNNYSLVDNNSGVLHLTLYDSPFGNISGNIPMNFIETEEITNAPFTQLIAGNPQSYCLWLRKVN